MKKHLALILLVLGPAFLSAETSPATFPISGRGEVRIDSFKYAEFRVEEKVFIARGDIHLTYGDFTLYADGVVYWLDEGRLYAEGNIRAEKPPWSFAAERAYFDLVNRTGLLDSALLKTYDLAREVPIVIFGQTIREVSPGKYQIRNGYFTTCNFGVPHYRLSADTATVETLEDGDFRWSARGIKFRLGDRPLFFLPGLSGKAELGEEGQLAGEISSPIQSLRIGSSSRMGNYILTRWRFRAGEQLEILPRLDYRTRRGPALGLDLSRETESGFLDLTSYYINDSGTDKDGTEPESDDRGRLKARSRWQMSENWRLDAEFQYLSDDDFLNEFFEKEFKEEKEPETYLYLRHMRDQQAFTGLFRYRLNDFQDQTEYLPSLGFDLIGKPLLGSRLYLTGHSEVAQLRRKPVSGFLAPPIESLRSDNQLELAAPFSLGIIGIRPYVEAGATAYSDSPSGSSETRETAAAGVTLSTRFVRAFASGVTHHIIPELSYSDLFRVTTPASTLYQFDENDTVSEGRLLTFRLRNVIYSGTDAGRREALRLILKTDYRPDPDDFGEEHHLSNVRTDFWFYPWRSVSVTGDWEVNPHNGHTEVAEASFAFKPRRPLSAKLGFRYIDDQAAAAQASFKSRLSSHWSISAGTEYNFLDGHPISSELALIRDMHMWTLELGFERDSGEDETTFAINISPKGFF